METSLTVCLLALFIVKGLSLECEECVGLGGCSGNMVTCDFGEDRCSVTHMDLPLGARGPSLTIKACVSSDVCDKGVQVINLGQSKNAVAHLKCCEGEECNNGVRPELPKKAPANGNQCPACLELGETCREEVTNCTGDELYCAEGHLDSQMGIVVRMKGCANKALCGSLAAYEAMAPENSRHHAFQCTTKFPQEFSTDSLRRNVTGPGSSGRVNTIPRWFGLFLTILSGVLLRKLLA
ncbi:phospholipase A2 inhibitor NAI-like [Erythrolamprus reginae]|uniref:phospholipase A2 inhibitor NAI-like n=1 Tax=Erythrolamprus reginae TaxID=121349 RepID=UPI00396CB98B